MKKTLLFIAFLALMALAFISCGTHKDGCYSTRGMSGYHK